jgi:hypothetical protein
MTAFKTKNEVIDAAIEFADTSIPKNETSKIYWYARDCLIKGFVEGYNRAKKDFKKDKNRYGKGKD